MSFIYKTIWQLEGRKSDKHSLGLIQEKYLCSSRVDEECLMFGWKLAGHVWDVLGKDWYPIVIQKCQYCDFIRRWSVTPDTHSQTHQQHFVCFLEKFGALLLILKQKWIERWHVTCERMWHWKPNCTFIQFEHGCSQLSYKDILAMANHSFAWPKVNKKENFPGSMGT